MSIGVGEEEGIAAVVRGWSVYLSEGGSPIHREGPPSASPRECRFCPRISWQMG